MLFYALVPLYSDTKFLADAVLKDHSALATDTGKVRRTFVILATFGKNTKDDGGLVLSKFKNFSNDMGTQCPWFERVGNI